MAAVGFEGTDLVQVSPWAVRDAWRKSGFEAGLICLVQAGGMCWDIGARGG